MNTTDFLTALKRAVGVPTYQPRFSDTDLLAIASEEQKILLVPFLASLKGEFFIRYTTLTQPKTVAEFQIPDRCVGRSLREVKYQERSSLIYDLPQVSTEDVQRFANMGDGSPAAFYVRDDQIVLLPTPSTDGTLHVWYPMAPSDLTVAQYNVTTIAGQTLTLDDNPFVPGDSVDLIATAGRPKVLQTFDVLLSSGNNITLDTTETIQPCQIVSAYNTSPVIMLPDEAVQVLVYAAALRVLVSLNLQDDANRIEKDLVKRMEYCGKSLTPRVEGANKKIIQRNGLLRGRVSGRRFPSVSVP